MSKEDDIISEFYTRLDRFVLSPAMQHWRDEEVRTNYRVLAGDQWSEADAKQREKKHKPITYFNNIAPVVRAISGYEIMNRTKINYYPRRSNPETEEQTDIMSDAVEYIQDDSNFFTESSNASEDALTCGLGATATYFNYSNPEAPYGEVCEERIYPGFLLYDNQVRGKLLNKRAKWAGYVEVVSKEWLDREIEKATGESVMAYTAGAQSRRTHSFLQFFEAYTDLDEVDIVYHYEWKEPETVWRVSNPFEDEMLADMRPLTDPATGGSIPVGQFIERAAERIADEYSVNLEEGTWLLTQKQYREYRKGLGNLTELTGYEFPVNPQKSEQYKYYKARIARETVLDWSESWTQTGFTITYKTGYYDEQQAHFYGIVRDMKEPQDKLNKAVSDYVSYLESVPKGGIYFEETAVKDAKKFIESRVNEQNATMLADGGLGRIQPKEVPQAPGGLSDFINFCSQQITRVIGLSPDFLGMVESGNMTNALYGKLVKQAYMVLANFFDSNREYMRRKGKIFLDCTRILAENNNGMMLRRLSNQNNEDAYIRLQQDQLSSEYDIVVADRPMTDDEKQQNFNMMLELQTKMPNRDLMPLALEYAPIEQEKKQQIEQMMQPPQPDPEQVALDRAMVESQIAFQYAEADARKARAEKDRAEIATSAIETRLQRLEALYARAREEAEIEEIESKTALNMARAGKEVKETVTPQEVL